MKKLQIAFVLFLLTLFMNTTDTEAASVDDIRFYVESFYYGEQPKNIKSMQTIAEITKTLDEYSRYMSPAEYKEYKTGVTFATAEIETEFDPETVTSALIYGDIGYIKIARFTLDLPQELAEHYLSLEKKGAKELIIDLRYNGGGYVNIAEKLLGFFPDAPTAYALSTRERDKVILSTPSTVSIKYKPYILVNRYTASASEMVAISLQDQNAAIIVGGQTKGKATVQSLFEFPDGSALKLTTGKFAGPNGTNVQDVGVTPDIKVAIDKELTMLHHQLLEDSFKQMNYQAYQNAEQTKSDTSIHLKLPYKMNFVGPRASNKVQVIHLGGKQIPVKLTQQKDRLSLDIKPFLTTTNKAYMVIIGPATERINGKRRSQKTYTTILDNTLGQ